MTPKEQFLETAHAAEHAKLVQTDAFREASNYAMLQFQQNVLAESATEGSSLTDAKVAAMIAGAARFRIVLENIATTTADVPRGTQPKVLNHDAYDPRRRTA